MSRFSGKCDLYDHMCMEKHRTKDGSDKKEDLEKATVLYSDPIECFEIFKKKTGGVLHQHRRVKEVSEWNHDFIKAHCPMFEIITHIDKITDKRSKTGYREKTYYTYKYWDKEYTAKELSKKGVYITMDIHFETMLDLIPYFPYIISSCCCSKDEETIYISNQSYVDEQYDELIQNGVDPQGHKEWYNRELANFYKEYILEQVKLS